MAFHLLLTILIFSSTFSFTWSDPILSNVTLWCNQTSYTELCQQFIGQHPQSLAIKHNKTEFEKMAISIALDQTLQAQKNFMLYATKLQNEHHHQAAMADCIQLYDSTQMRLNFIVDHYGKYTDLEVQTWLSAALTNLETCRTSLMEVGVVSDAMLERFVSKNVSKLITNALGINRVIPNDPTYNKHKIPAWMNARARRKLLEDSNSSTSQAYFVVAQDGSGNFKTIQEAINAVSKGTNQRSVIYVKAGVYKEIVEINNMVQSITMIGDGIGKTIITGNNGAAGNHCTTYSSATFAVHADGFIARGMTFRNTAGPSNGQAVAVLTTSDRSVFYKCSFEGYQDTLFVHSNRQFYRECDIYGTVDFIFGDAVALFQNCNIYPRGNINTITAQGRIEPVENTGIVIDNSKVMVAPGLNSLTTYLGRPWKNYSRTVFLKTYLDRSVVPAGWLEWNANSDNIYYGEYENSGPGSSTSSRVKWRGFHVITRESEAMEFTVASFLGGDSWLPATKVPFSDGL